LYIYATLLAADWIQAQGYSQQQLSDPFFNADDVFILSGTELMQDQNFAAQAANLSGMYDDGQLYVFADGAVPTIDIPITITRMAAATLLSAPNSAGWQSYGAHYQ
jgi:hypothetical protein